MAHPISILSWVNHVDAGVLSASQSVGDMAPSNMAEPVVGRRWRTTSLTAYGQIDFGADKSIGVLALRFPRDTTFPTVGTVTHALDADGGTPGAGATYSNAAPIDAAAGYGYHVHVPASAVTARYWRFTFSGLTGVAFVDVGRAWAGASWQPTHNIAFGYEDLWGDLSGVSTSRRSGAEFVDPRARQRAFAFGFAALSEAERDDIRELQRIAGIEKQLLFVKNPTTPSKETVLGRLSQTTPIRHANLPIYSKAFQIRESL